jgi:predicted amidohydrolase YtcJ
MQRGHGYNPFTLRTLYRASRVRTLSHPAVGEWVLVDGRHIERVGVGDAPSAERVVDLPGATIMPGFVDAHVHLTWSGIHRGASVLSDVGSSAELLQAARGITPTRTGITFAFGWDESAWRDPELPCLAELDSLEGPVVLARTDGHVCLANTAALQRSGAITLTGVERDADGQPTGLLTQQANDTAQSWFHGSLSDPEIEGFQVEAASVAAARGVTSVHEMSEPAMDGPHDLEILLRHRRSLPVDVITYVATTDVPAVMDMRLSRIGGDIAIDGSLGARTAHLNDPYHDAPTVGVGYHDDEALFAFLHQAHVAGLQVGLHAIGDAAIEQVVSAWERVYLALDSRMRRHFRARRHRIEHFEMPGPGHIERAAVLGLAPCVQPAFDARWGGVGALYETRVGTARAAAMNPFRTMRQRGLELGCGSDSPVTPLDPLAGVAALESHHDPQQRFDREEALRLFIQGGARLGHQEDKKGALEPGAHADLCAWDADPCEADLDGMRPILTVSLGREVFAS